MMYECYVCPLVNLCHKFIMGKVKGFHCPNTSFTFTWCVHLVFTVRLWLPHCDSVTVVSKAEDIHYQNLGLVFL